MTFLAEFAMLSHGWRRFLLLLVTGALAGLSVPPLFIVPALFVALPVLVWTLDGAERRRGLGLLFGPAFRIGFSFAWGYFLVAFHWLGAAFFVEGGAMLIAMPFGVAALAALIAVFWGFGAALAHALWSPGALRIVTLATCLAGAEWVRGHAFSGFPFDLVGYALTANDQMAQLASVIGVYGLTALALLLAMTPALIWPADQRGLARRLLPFFMALAAIAAQVGYGNWRLDTTLLADRTDVKFRLIQPVMLEHAGFSRTAPSAVIDSLLALSETRITPDDAGLAGITHLVWPESSLPFFFSEYPEGLARIARMLPAGVMLLTGAPREDYEATAADGERHPGYNALLAIDSDGEQVARYDKSHLVPFGEYLPFEEQFAAIGIAPFVPGASGWAPGDGKRLLLAPGTPAFLALICYEAVFSGDLGGIDPTATAQAQFILNISNDAWFDGSIGPAQHAHHARMRAIEEGLPLIRATNSGLTFMADPLGRITAALAPGQPALMDVVPAEKLGSTPFQQLRHWPFLGALGLGLLLSILARWRQRNRR